MYVLWRCKIFIRIFIEAQDTPLIAMGDLNARMGDLNEVKNEYTYNKNVDFPQAKFHPKIIVISLLIVLVDSY